MQEAEQKGAGGPEMNLIGTFESSNEKKKNKKKDLKRGKTLRTID